MKKIDCFIPFAGKEQAEKTVQGLQATGLIGNIRLVTTDPMLEPLPGCEILSVDMPYSSTAMKTMPKKPMLNIHCYTPKKQLLNWVCSPWNA